MCVPIHMLLWKFLWLFFPETDLENSIDDFTPIKAKNVKVIVAQSCPTLCNPMDCSPPGFSVHGDSSGRNTGVGCHTLLQGIFQPRNQTPVSCIAGRSLMSEQSKQESFNLKNPLAKLFLTSVVQSLKHYFKWLFWVKITDYFSFFALYISPLF